MNNLIAMVLDGAVISAPRVRSEMSNEAMLTGNTPAGVAPAVVDRILSLVKR